MATFSTRLSLLLSTILLICWQHQGLAQQTPPNLLDCRTPDLTDQQKRDLDAAAKFAFQIKKAQNDKAFTGITYVPIRPHIVRQSDGTGGMTLTRMNHLMAQTNRYYLLSGSGIQFYFAGASPDYIDNTALYNSFSEGNLPNGTDATNAMNMYFIHSPGPNANYGGYAYYPTTDLSSTRSVIAQAANDYLGRFVIPHELGHNFNLFHTFGNTNSGNSAELVTRGAGANCSSTGDLICDTPADPHGPSCGGYAYNSAGCAVYTGTCTDANGDTYNPQTGNTMSYYFDGGPACLRFFTAGQYDRMQAGLALRQTHTAYSLNAPATPVTAPTNLLLSLTGAAVQLTWQDNATNEMGYFVERATTTNGPFDPVGGVPPNTATFADQTATPGTAYYYRIRPSNTTTGHLSPVQTITTPQAPCLPTYAIGCSDNNGLTGLILNGDTLSRNSGCSLTGYQLFSQRQTALFSGQTYSFTAQLGSATSNAGLAIWIDANRDGRYDTAERRFQNAPEVTGQIARSFTIPAGIAPGPVGMRVMTASDLVDIEACSSYRGGEAEDYTLTIISTCPAPGSPVTSLRSPFGAQLTWANAGDGLHYDLLWRISGSGTWTYINDVPVPAYNLTGLQPGTAYDWQVRTRCDPVSETAFTTPISFTTLTTCPDPANLTTNTSTPTSIRFGWTGTGPGVTYDLRYKPQTSSDWITLTGLTSTGLTATLTNPQPTVVYNWAVRTNCGSTGTTNWVNGPDFALFCPEPTSLTITGIADNSAQLQWQNPPGGSGTYDLQWKSISASTWNTVSGIAGNTYSLTGLQLDTFYNWQVRAVCTAMSYSYYTPTMPFTTGGCRPTFSSGCSYGSVTGLNSLSLNGTTLSTNSGCSPSGYSQFTATTATVSPGGAYSFAGTLLNQTTPAGFSVWIDTNRNGRFDSNEVVFSPGQPVTGAFTGAFLVPATLTPGPLALRIILIANANPASASACGSFSAGEAEDYRLEVVPATGCVLPVLTLSGSTTIAAGLAAPLTVLLTGNQPQSFTIGNNGTAQMIIVPGSSMPMAYYYIPVNPTATTLYFPLSVSNACGTGTVSGSAVITVQNCDAPSSLAETEQTTTSVRLTWQPLAVATGYTVIYRLVGSPTATTTTVTGTNSLAVYGLTYGAVYEWQVSSNCSFLTPVFSPVRSFTMNCSPPYGLSEVVTGTSSVRLQWTWPGSNTVEMQYRPVGTTDWTGATLTGGYFYNLSGLVVGVTYQWRIRTFCSGTVGEYSAIRTFTIPCNAPSLYSINLITATTTQLSWQAGNGVLYDMRWRVKSQPEESYTTISGIQGGFSAYTTGIANLTGLTNNTAYEWQVRTVCSATAVSAFGPVQSFTTGCGAIQSAYFGNVTSTGVLLNWSSSNYTSRYNVVYRVAGSPTSTTVSALSFTAYQLNGLTNGTVYEFAVQVLCSDGSLSAFSAPRSFTTQCVTPGSYFASTPGSNNIRLSWSTTGADTRYDLVYRIAGSPTSTTISALTIAPGQTTLYHNLTGLMSNTAYEWKIRTACADGNSSAFIQPQFFTTIPCPLPDYPYEVYVLNTVARVTWGTKAGLSYEIQWRPTGSATWPASATVTATEDAYLAYTITGLTNNTGYEWRIAARCPDNTQSVYNQPRSFTTNCPSASSPFTSGITSAGANLNWYGNSLLTYKVRWRIVNGQNPAWNESAPLPANTNAYSVTGLSNGTTYEWQVGMVCDEGIIGYGASMTFVTGCPVPGTGFTASLTDRTAVLNFSAGFNLPGLRYDVQYQPQGGSGWTLISNINSTTLLLTTLSATTGYTWQVRTICTDGSLSAFGSSQSFTTLTACPLVYTVRDGYWSDSSVWSCGWVPTLGHEVEIRHVVTLSGSILNQARRVRYGVGGKLVYLPGGKLRLGQ